MDKLRILGIDPGLRVTGYSLIDKENGRPRIVEAGIIRSTPPGQAPDLGQRLKEIFDSVAGLISQFGPAVMAVEQLFAHYKHPRTAILMAHARGAILLCAGNCGIPIVSYNATRIKKTITGNGRATKEQIQRTLQRELNLSQMPEPPDVADALAVALCHFYCQKIPE